MQWGHERRGDPLFDQAGAPVSRAARLPKDTGTVLQGQESGREPSISLQGNVTFPVRKRYISSKETLRESPTLVI
jgi:hypothetical protein